MFLAQDPCTHAQTQNKAREKERRPVGKCFLVGIIQNGAVK